MVKLKSYKVATYSFDIDDNSRAVVKYLKTYTLYSIQVFKWVHLLNKIPKSIETDWHTLAYCIEGLTPAKGLTAEECMRVNAEKSLNNHECSFKFAIHDLAGVRTDAE